MGALPPYLFGHWAIATIALMESTRMVPMVTGRSPLRQQMMVMILLIQLKPKHQGRNVQGRTDEGAKRP